jgi:hypothetical protein
VGSIHRGVVQTLKPFGVFVAIEGYRRHVLIHHTQVCVLDLGLLLFQGREAFGISQVSRAARLSELRMVDRPNALSVQCSVERPSPLALSHMCADSLRHAVPCCVVLCVATQVSDLVMLTRSDEDELKVKALEFAVTPGQRVWAKVREGAAEPLCTSCLSLWHILWHTGVELEGGLEVLSLIWTAPDSILSATTGLHPHPTQSPHNQLPFPVSPVSRKTTTHTGDGGVARPGWQWVPHTRQPEAGGPGHRSRPGPHWTAGSYGRARCVGFFGGG